MAVLPYDTAIQKHLCPGEELRWVGRARQGWRYRWSNRLVIVQTAAAVLSLVWLFRFAIWSMSELGFNAGPMPTHPSLRSSILVFALGAITTWQLLAERRRRAGTWYAVTDRRVLFVLTTVYPQSVIGVEFDEIAGVSTNAALDAPAPAKAIILQLKHVDPYLCASRVLGYQMGTTTIILEDIEDAQEFYKQIMRRGRLDGSSAENWPAII
ncbi:MAG TPA: hypothetical protein VH370_10300 [Humisphaera sp.]|jgi:hypothetical protein|nr:hypothetical protein [Humisphaera sp.]